MHIDQVHPSLRTLYLENKVLSRMYSATIGGIFLKLEISFLPSMRYEQCEFGSDRSVIKHTLLGDQSTFSAATRLPLKTSNFKHRTIHAWAQSVVVLVAIAKSITALYFDNKEPLRLYHGFHFMDFPEISYLALSTHALQTVEVLLLAVNN